MYFQILKLEKTTRLNDYYSVKELFLAIHTYFIEPHRRAHWHTSVNDGIDFDWDVDGENAQEEFASINFISPARSRSPPLSHFASATPFVHSLASLISQTSRRKRQPSVWGMNNLPEVLNSSLRRSADSLQWMDGEWWRCDAEARCRQREREGESERNMVWRKMSRERMHRQGDEFGVSSAHRAVIISRQWMEKKNVSAIH